MNKKVVNIALLAGMLLVGAVTLVKVLEPTDDYQVAMERAIRMSNLSLIAVQNGDYALACRAQRDVADAIVQAHVKGTDIYGVTAEHNKEFCIRAGF